MTTTTTGSRAKTVGELMVADPVRVGGGLTVQAGWSWFGDTSSNLLRVGLHYYNGESNQFSFFDRNEEQLGFGVWYDF